MSFSSQEAQENGSENEEKKIKDENPEIFEGRKKILKENTKEDKVELHDNEKNSQKITASQTLKKYVIENQDEVKNANFSFKIYKYFMSGDHDAKST